ncbi:MAG: hypothetical protein JOZ62_07705 [Acidobacteriaceae bacterium]|nr:hypothetical protein [Acidobacteriaceae bacterium]
MRANSYYSRSSRDVKSGLGADVLVGEEVKSPSTSQQRGLPTRSPFGAASIWSEIMAHDRLQFQPEAYYHWLQ